MKNDYLLVKNNGEVKYSYKCKKWIKKEQDDTVSFQQDCIGRYNIKNTILVDKLGFINEINQGLTD